MQSVWNQKARSAPGSFYAPHHPSLLRRRTFRLVTPLISIDFAPPASSKTVHAFKDRVNCPAPFPLFSFVVLAPDHRVQTCCCYWYSHLPQTAIHSHGLCNQLLRLQAPQQCVVSFAQAASMVPLTLINRRKGRRGSPQRLQGQGCPNRQHGLQMRLHPAVREAREPVEVSQRQAPR